MSVRPNRSQGMTWWIWQWSNAMSQCGWAQVRYIARSARRWARLATRCSRPTASVSPSVPNTIGMMAASQHNRRIVSTGSGIPLEVSQIDEAWSPSVSVGRSTCTHTSGTRRSPVLAGVAATTSTRATTVSCSRGISRVAVALCDGVELGVDRGPQLGAGFGVDFGVEVPHPGDLVDPASHRRVRLLTVELADTAVTGEQPGEVAAVLVELGDRVARRGGQQIGFERRQLRAGRIVEMAGGVGERVDVAGADRAIGERIFERRQLVAHRGPIGGSFGFFAGAPPAAAQDLGRGGVDTRRGVRRHTSGDGDVDRVDPPAHPCAQLDNVGQFAVVAHRQGRAPTALRRLSESPSRTYVHRDICSTRSVNPKVGESW